MHQTTRIKIDEVNPHLVCVLCGGYFVDATTIVECLHSFCKTCIVRYLETSKYCPICDVMVHKTRPLVNIKSDQTLQDLVYKLVPGLFTSEMKRRKEFYASHPLPGSSHNHLFSATIVKTRATIYPEDEKISLSLEFSPNGRPVFKKRGLQKRKIEDEAYPDKRYLLCPAGFTIGHLKKFVKMKFSLSDTYVVDIFYVDESLNDQYTLMDIAYIYTWRRRVPMRLFYSIFEVPLKRIKLQESSLVINEQSTENPKNNGLPNGDKTSNSQSLQPKSKKSPSSLHSTPLTNPNPTDDRSVTDSPSKSLWTSTAKGTSITLCKVGKLSPPNVNGETAKSKKKNTPSPPGKHKRKHSKGENGKRHSKSPDGSKKSPSESKSKKSTSGSSESSPRESPTDKKSQSSNQMEDVFTPVTSRTESRIPSVGIAEGKLEEKAEKSKDFQNQNGELPVDKKDNEISLKLKEQNISIENSVKEIKTTENQSKLETTDVKELKRDSIILKTPKIGHRISTDNKTDETSVTLNKNKPSVSGETQASKGIVQSSYENVKVGPDLTKLPPCDSTGEQKKTNDITKVLEKSNDKPLNGNSITTENQNTKCTTEVSKVTTLSVAIETEQDKPLDLQTKKTTNST